MPSGSTFPENLFEAACPEFLLAATCCIWPPSEDREERLSRLLQGPLDWPKFLQLVRRHRIPGLAHQALNDRIEIPAEVRAALSESATKNAVANLKTSLIQANLAKLFEREAIDFVVMKGLLLGQLAYQNAALRHSKDIDILVSEKDMARIEMLLVNDGFRRTLPAMVLTTRQLQLWMKFRKHFEYVHSATGTMVELHWKMYDNRRMDADAHIIERREWITTPSGTRFPVVPQEELLLSLCAHGAGHLWFRLKWLADVGSLLAQEPFTDRTQLVKTARGRDLDRAAIEALVLCKVLLGVPSTGFTCSSTARWLTRTSRDAMLADVSQGPSDAQFVPKRLIASTLLLSRSWSYRMEEVQVHLASPTDWETFPLPGWLQFLYPLFRFPLWIVRRRKASIKKD